QFDVLQSLARNGCLHIMSWGYRGVNAHGIFPCLPIDIEFRFAPSVSRRTNNATLSLTLAPPLERHRFDITSPVEAPAGVSSPPASLVRLAFDRAASSRAVRSSSPSSPCAGREARWLFSSGHRTTHRTG